MTDKQSRVARETVKCLMDRKRVKASEISQITEASRPTVLKVLGCFMDDKIINKNGTQYGFGEQCAAVFVEVNEQRGEISAYAFGEGSVSRVGFDFSDMLTFNDNVLRLCKRAEEYADFLRIKHKRVFCLFIDGRAEKRIAFSTPAFFDLSVEKDLLIVDAMHERVGEIPCIYVDECCEYMLLCVGGRKIKEMRVSAEDIDSMVSDLARVIRPELAIIDMLSSHEKAEKIKAIFEENCINTECVGGGWICFDKREALIRMLCTKIK